MKKSLAIAAICLLTLPGLAACGSDHDDATATATASTVSSVDASSTATTAEGATGEDTTAQYAGTYYDEEKSGDDTVSIKAVLDKDGTCSIDIKQNDTSVSSYDGSVCGWYADGTAFFAGNSTETDKSNFAQAGQFTDGGATLSLQLGDDQPLKLQRQ